MIFNMITKYVDPIQEDEHHRYKSWEHCFEFFSGNMQDLEGKVELASLHLAFYLASWGMLRGSSFLLQKDYFVHKYFIQDVVMKEKYTYIQDQLDDNYIENILELVDETKAVYKNNIHSVNGEKKDINITDTLVTKILLGVYGNVPAYDRYLVSGLKLHGINGSLNKKSLKQLVDFYQTFEQEFLKSQQYIKRYTNVKYSPMKLLDMYFWEVGYLLDTEKDNEDIQQFANEYKSTIFERKQTLSATSY